MLLPQYLLHGYKQLFLCSLKSGSINKCVWARNAESSTVVPNGLTDQTAHKNEVHANINESAEDEDYRRLHIPVMVKEVIDCFSPQPGQCFLDMTFGAGGHTVALLQKASDIKVYALDRDPAAYQIAQQLSDSYPSLADMFSNSFCNFKIPFFIACICLKCLILYIFVMYVSLVKHHHLFVLNPNVDEKIMIIASMQGTGLELITFIFYVKIKHNKNNKITSCVLTRTIFMLYNVKSYVEA